MYKVNSAYCVYNFSITIYLPHDAGTSEYYHILRPLVADPDAIVWSVNFYSLDPNTIVTQRFVKGFNSIPSTKPFVIWNRLTCKR